MIPEINMSSALKSEYYVFHFLLAKQMFAVTHCLSSFRSDKQII